VATFCNKPRSSDAFLADPVAQRLLVASARIAFDDGRAMFGLRDLLRAIDRDDGASRLLAGLGPGGGGHRGDPAGVA
jgi:hypothetical protein